jgi:hypothetical protein
MLLPEVFALAVPATSSGQQEDEAPHKPMEAISLKPSRLLAQ